MGERLTLWDWLIYAGMALCGAQVFGHHDFSWLSAMGWAAAAQWRFVAKRAVHRSRLNGEGAD